MQEPGLIVYLQWHVQHVLCLNKIHHTSASSPSGFEFGSSHQTPKCTQTHRETALPDSLSHSEVQSSPAQECSSAIHANPPLLDLLKSEYG